jgi:prepilin-type N-terminal cleavage/methylation domain-containing protein
MMKSSVFPRRVKVLRLFPIAPRAESPRGFSLIELTVVMVILSLLLGGLLLPLSAQRDLMQRRAAESGLMEIREALLGYAALHDTLPCPDLEENPEAATYGEAEDDCAFLTREGFVPFKTLGLSETADPWGQRWRYRVDPNFVVPIKLNSAADHQDSRHLRIVNAAGKDLTAHSKEPAIVLFYSTGANARADGENAVFEPTGGRYESNPPSDVFDDQMLWLARPALFARLIAAGKF